MKGRILTSILAMMAIAGLQAQEIPAVPKLVVGLTIDQLRMEYVEAFSAMYGERGFKRLWKEGRVYRNAEYDFVNVDRSSAIAAFIARGLSLEDAISEAKNYVTEAIRAGADINIGKGIGPVNHSFNPQKMIVL